MIFVYDGTLEGLLSAIFEIYRLKVTEVTDISPEERHREELFSDSIRVDTVPEHAARVLAGLERRSGNGGLRRWLLRALLSEHERVERLVLHYCRRQFTSEHDVSQDSADPRIRQLQRLDQQMGREIHRLHQFVRFQETPDGLFVALINPDFNVLPVGCDHFVARYPAMHWLIYDTRRHYGFHWDPELRRAEFTTLDTEQDGRLRYLSQEMLAGGETDYQQLWQTYFRSVDIPERRNLKVHLAHVPRRYHRYLTEKTGR